MIPALADLDTGDVLSLLETVVGRRRQVEVEDLLLVLHYADLHAAIAADTGPGGETLGDLGGEGTPGVKELAIVELGVARSVHTHSARHVVADALDLRHRLPHTWDTVRHLHAEVWVARRVASLTRRLSYEAVGLVDRAVADAITGQSPGRVLDLAAAKIIEADQAGHDARVATERHRRFVALSRTDPTGLRSVIARTTAGDAADVDTLVQQIADHLHARGEYAGLGADELRAEAFAWLARPEDVTALLAGQEQPRRTRRTSVLYVHLSEAALAGVSGVARVEGLGPHSLTQLTALLAHDRVIVKPVIDLNEQISTNAYEYPEAMKERIHLKWCGDAFPHATRTTRTERSVDIDHPVSYDEHGPPDQTNSDTGQPLSRTPHRAKTHLGYQCTPTGTGEMLWRTPHGLHRIVDAHGTHPITEADHDAWLSPDDLDRALVRLTHRLHTGALDL